MRRPGWILGLTWLITCLIGGWLSLPVLLTVFVGGTVCFCVFLCIPRCRQVVGLLPVVGAVCAAVLSLVLCESVRYAPIKKMVGKELWLHVQVCSDDGQAVLQVKEGDLPVGTRLALWCRQEHLPVGLYDHLEGMFVLCDRETSQFSQLQNKAGGVWFAVVPTKIEELSVRAGEPPWTAALSQLRRSTVKRINGVLTGDVATVITGICLGADEQLSYKATRDFRETGVFHLFSVSGFHLALIAQGIHWLLLRLGASRRLRAVLISLSVLLFMGLVGLESAVIRSGLLCLLVQLSACLRRQADSCNSLGLALLVLLVADPYAAYDVGLLLSFTATFGLVLLAPVLQEWCLSRLPKRWIAGNSRCHKAVNGLLTAVCVTVSATVATMPISVLFFGRFSLVSVPANLLTSLPATVLMLFGGIACVLLFPGWTVLARPFLLVAGVIARYLLWIAEKISTFSFATVAITDTFLVLWVCGTIPLLLAGWWLARKRGLRVTVALAVFTLSAALLVHTLLMRGVSKIGVIPTEGEAATYVQSDGRVVLICSLTDADTLYAVRSQLYRDGIDRVDVLVIPHGKEAVLTAMPSLWGSFLRDTVVLYGEAEPTAYTGQMQPLRPSMVLWEGMEMETADEFLLLSIKGTRVLLSLGGGQVAALKPWQYAPQVVVYAGEVPKDAFLLQSPKGVLQSAKAYQPMGTDYGVRQLLIANEATVSLFTRGAGELN